MTGAKTNVTASHAVNWWSVHTYVDPLLRRVGSWPMAGTPEWCNLSYNDPAHWAALFDAAQHHVLRVETAQVTLAEASHEVADAADWKAIATHQVRHAGAIDCGTFIPRRAAS